MNIDNAKTDELDFQFKFCYFTSAHLKTLKYKVEVFLTAKRDLVEKMNVCIPRTDILLSLNLFLFL